MTEVSVVIATFQRPDACERAVASALAQTTRPIEVLVCDDGSADATPERVRALEARDPRVRYLRLEPNRGTPGPSRNAGARAARGDWIAFLDDDQWLPHKLERQLAHAGKADVIGANARSPSGRPYFPSAPPLVCPSRAQIVADNPLIVSTTLVRRDLLLAAGGFMREPWARGVADYG